MCHSGTSTSPDLILDLWPVIAGHTKWQAMKIGANGANCFMNLLLSSPLSLLSWPDCRWGLAAIIVSLDRIKNYRAEKMLMLQDEGLRAEGGGRRTGP